MIVLSYWLLGLFLGFCLADYRFLTVPDRKRLPKQWLLHFGIYVAGQVLTLLFPLTAIIAASYSLAHGIGLLAWLGIGPIFGFLVWILADSFAEYISHVAAHRYPLLWAFHRVHHCDELVDASTGIRHHPLDALWALCVQSVTAFVVAPASETILIWYFFLIAMQFYSHSRIDLPDRINSVLEKFFATPHIHRVHHSSYAAQTDSNYGGFFTIWDRIFGTFRNEIPEHLGLDDEALSGKNSRDFDTLILEPFNYLWRKWRNRKKPSVVG